MLLGSRLCVLGDQDFLYGKGDSSDFFYFVLQGSIQIRVIEQDAMKFSKTVDESTFFGFRDGIGEKRNDFASAPTADTMVIVLDTSLYKKLITNNVMSKGDRKIDFLMQHGPQLRMAGRRMLEQYEIYFMKEKVTQGY